MVGNIPRKKLGFFVLEKFSKIYALGARIQIKKSENFSRVGHPKVTLYIRTMILTNQIVFFFKEKIKKISYIIQFVVYFTAFYSL